MFRIHARGYTGWLAWCFLLAGLFTRTWGGAGVILGGLLMSCNDIEFTALGLVELGGGKVATLPNNLADWFSVGVLSVGSISLIAGRLIGLTITLIQFTVIQRDQQTDTQVIRSIPVDPLARMLIWGLIVFNVMTTWYYLNGNTFLDVGNASLSAFVNGFLKSAWTLLAAFALFSFGPEWVVVYGISLTRANWPNVLAFFSDEAPKSKTLPVSSARSLSGGNSPALSRAGTQTTPDSASMSRTRRSGANGREGQPN